MYFDLVNWHMFHACTSDSSRYGEAYIRPWNERILVQSVACRLPSAKPFPCWFIVVEISADQVQWLVVEIQTMHFEKKIPIEPKSVMHEWVLGQMLPWVLHCNKTNWSIVCSVDPNTTLQNRQGIKQLHQFRYMFCLILNRLMLHGRQHI